MIIQQQALYIIGTLHKTSSIWMVLNNTSSMLIQIKQEERCPANGQVAITALDCLVQVVFILAE